MTTIKQVFLGAAVAGVVAGAGSAVGTAVAYADPSGADTTNTTSTSDGPSQESKSSTKRSRPAAAGTSRGSNAPQTGESDAPRKKSQARGAARNQTSDQTQNDRPELAPPKTGGAQQVESEANEPAVSATIETTVTRNNSPAPAAATAAPAVAIAVEPAIAAPAALTPAPAAPAPTPVRLPLLPDLPALPVAPASAVTVSATSGTNNRLRAASAVAQAAVLADPPTHVLLIGTDGTNLSKILQYAYDTPDSGFRAVMDDGITGTTSLVGHTTISGPSWSTILTGAWDNKTGIINNLFNPEPYKKWPTVFNLIEYNKPAVNTAVIADWRYINDIADAGGYPADINEFIEFTNTWEDTDDAVAARTIELINAASAEESTFLFSYQVAVDEEGHLHGGGSQQYADAVINTSENIKAIMDAVDAWELANPGEKWTVIVTTDHGHQQSEGFGHGFQSPNETSSFVIFDLEGDDANDGKQNLGYANTDITPTIVSLFGIDQRSDFDGVPLQTKGAGIVTPDDLKQALNDALSMYGYPNIGTDVALGARTVFASIPYFIDGFTQNITAQLQAIVDKDIFLLSGIAQATQWVVQFNGDLLVGVTQAVARVVARLTGSGTIAPTDPPLPAPPAGTEPPVLDSAAVLASAVSPLASAPTEPFGQSRGGTRRSVTVRLQRRHDPWLDTDRDPDGDRIRRAAQLLADRHQFPDAEPPVFPGIPQGQERTGRRRKPVLRRWRRGHRDSDPDRRSERGVRRHRLWHDDVQSQRLARRLPLRHVRGIGEGRLPRREQDLSRQCRTAPRRRTRTLVPDRVQTTLDLGRTPDRDPLRASLGHAR